jgi:phosphoribosylamine--glycine ligase
MVDKNVTILPMASSQDHKARDEGDMGPNTGGMGAYSPAPIMTPELDARVIREIIRPTIDGMKQEGTPYKGFLYAGLMIDPEGNPKVLEYNIRFGDPECQPIMMRLKSDLVAHIQAALGGRLSHEVAEWDLRPALGVVMASGGYPGSYEKGYEITGHGLARESDEKAFHAGTTLNDAGHVVTSGGRVLCVTALADSITEAQDRANGMCRLIHFEKCFYRGDIGHRAIARERAEEKTLG